MVFDEQFIEILSEDGNARRGWMLDLKRVEDETRMKMLEYQQIERELFAA